MNTETITQTPPNDTLPVLNEGQQAASDEFFQFLLRDEKEYNIRGAGGVGKTFLMGKFLDEVIPRYRKTCALMGQEPTFDEIVMTATTNKAADVLGRSTKRGAQTIHSFLRVIPWTDYATKKTKLKRKRDWAQISNVIVFIDECSMVDSQLYFEIHAALDDTCKIVYVGDHNQLAPINERISPIYQQQRGIRNSTLTENVRSAAQPALLAINQQLRDTVETGIFQPIQAVPGVIDALDGDGVEKEVQRLFSSNTFDHRILCYRNSQVLQYNEYIRQLRGLSQTITNGEVLTVNYGVKAKRDFIGPETEVQVRNITKPTLWSPSQTPEVEVAIQTADLETSYGHIFRDIPIAVDPNDRISMIKYLRKAKDWESERYLTERVADLRQRDAGTVYKAQGSTYHTVIIDLDDIAQCHRRETVARMLYVAFSRATTRIILHGSLPEKYGGVIE